MKRLAVAVLLCLGGCDEETGDALPEGRATDSLTAVENSIYAMVVDSFGGVPDTASYLVVLRESLVATPSDTTFVTPDSVVSAVAVRAYLQANLDTAYWTERTFDLGLPDSIIPQRTLDSMASPTSMDFWPNFHQRFAGANGYHAFSRIGFNADSTAGILTYQHCYGSLGADMLTLSAAWDGQQWRVHRVYRWIVAKRRAL